MALYNKTLTSNKIYGALANMIIGQYVEAKNVAHNYDLVSLFEDESGLCGDTKLYYDTDANYSEPFIQDSQTQLNVLSTSRPKDPYCQSVTINTYRQIAVTIDSILTKQAFFDEGTFQTVNDQFVAWVNETKKIHKITLVNSHVGTMVSEADASIVESPIAENTQGLVGNEKARVEAQTIANTIQNLVDDLKDYSREYNKIKFLRAYSEDDLLVIWNKDWVNKITKFDLPTMFHKDGLIKFSEHKLPARYFGDVVTADNIANYTAEFEESGADYKVKAGVTTVRALREFYVGDNHYFPGDVVPAEMTILNSARDAEDDSKLYVGEVYVENPDVICKITTKNAIKFLTAFSIGSEFWNAKNLSTNKYLTFGYSDIVLLDGKPLVTVEAD